MKLEISPMPEAVVNNKMQVWKLPKVNDSYGIARAMRLLKEAEYGVITKISLDKPCKSFRMRFPAYFGEKAIGYKVPFRFSCHAVDKEGKEWDVVKLKKSEATGYHHLYFKKEKKQDVELVCSNCNSTYKLSYKRNYQIGRTNKTGKRFCGNKCVAEYQKTHGRYWEKKEIDMKNAELVCSNCGKTFTRKYDYPKYRKTGNTFCCHKCSNEYHKNTANKESGKVSAVAKNEFSDVRKILNELEYGVSTTITLDKPCLRLGRKIRRNFFRSDKGKQLPFKFSCIKVDKEGKKFTVTKLRKDIPCEKAENTNVPTHTCCCDNSVPNSGHSNLFHRILRKVKELVS